MSVQGNGRATKKLGGVTGKGFRPGQSGNPGGMKAMPSDVKENLAANTMPRIKRLEKLSADAEAAGDLKTAAYIELALLKKSLPDATEMVIHVPDGIEVRQRLIDPKKLSADELQAFSTLVAKATKEGA